MNFSCRKISPYHGQFRPASQLISDFRFVDLPSFRISILCQLGCQLSQKCIYSVLYHKRTKLAVSKLSKPKVRLDMNVFLAQISRLQPGVKLKCELRARSASLTFGYQIRAGVQTHCIGYHIRKTYHMQADKHKR